MDPVGEVGTLTWRTSYDGNGNALSVTDPKEQVVTNTWGILGRVEKQAWSNHAAPRELPSISSIDYVYDGNGSLTKVTETKETASGPVSEVTDRVFDGLDRLTSEARLERPVEYQYDRKGNRIQVKSPDGVTTDYTYDALDRLATAAIGAEKTSYGYWPDSLQKETRYANGLKEKRCYDAASRLTVLVASKEEVSETCQTVGFPATRYGYAYDANGNRLAQAEERTDPVTQGHNGVEETGYLYDELDRLAAVRYPDGHVAAYDLDAVGNRVGERETLPGLVQVTGAIPNFDQLADGSLAKNVSASFNRVDWLLSQVDAADAAKSVSFEYDLNGNQTGRRTSAAAREMKWDARNTLTAVYENGVELGRYDYDRNLIRVRRTTANESVEYVLDDKHILNELDGSGNSIRRYHYGTKVLAVTEAASTNYLQLDALGSVVDFWSSTGTLAKSRQYDAWGNFRNGTAPAAGEAKVAYTGHQYDPETGWVYAKARYYDSALGVFLSRDSYEGEIANSPSLHRFMYAWDNPLRYIDPSGEAVCTGKPEECVALFDQSRKAAERLKSFDQSAVVNGANGSLMSFDIGGLNTLFLPGEGKSDRDDVQYVSWDSLRDALSGMSSTKESSGEPGSRKTISEKSLRQFNAYMDRIEQVERQFSVAGVASDQTAMNEFTLGSQLPVAFAELVGAGAKYPVLGLKPDDAALASLGAGDKEIEALWRRGQSANQAVRDWRKGGAAFTLFSLVAAAGEGAAASAARSMAGPRAFANRFPEDLASPVRGWRLEMREGKWVTVAPDGAVRTASGTYDFVVADGQILVDRPVKVGGQTRRGHVDLAGGMPVDYAGQVQFSGRTNRGQLKAWNNASGHYYPNPAFAEQAKLPLSKFEPVEVVGDVPQPGMPKD